MAFHVESWGPLKFKIKNIITLSQEISENNSKQYYRNGYIRVISFNPGSLLLPENLRNASLLLVLLRTLVRELVKVLVLVLEYRALVHVTGVNVGTRKLSLGICVLKINKKLREFRTILYSLSTVRTLNSGVIHSLSIHHNDYYYYFFFSEVSSLLFIFRFLVRFTVSSICNTYLAMTKRVEWYYGTNTNAAEERDKMKIATSHYMHRSQCVTLSLFHDGYGSRSTDFEQGMVSEIANVVDSHHESDSIHLVRRCRRCCPFHKNRKKNIAIRYHTIF